MFNNGWLLVGLAASLKIEMEKMNEVCKIDNSMYNLKKYFRAMEQYQSLRDLYVDLSLSLVEKEIEETESALEMKIREYLEAA